MASDGWVERTVDDVKSPETYALSTGPFGSAISSRHFVDFGVPVIRGGNLSQDVGLRLVDDNLAFLSTEKAAEFRRSVAKRGDLIFTCWGTVDQVGLVDGRSRYPEYIVSNKQMKFTPDPRKADSLFLYYLFSSPAMREQIVAQAIGTSVPGFNLGQLKALRLRLPHLPMQQRIAGILGAFDDKIALNQRMNATLAAMARTLFRSWFIAFDPVHAKAETRDPGLPTRMTDLFSDSFQDSQVGEIPSGWDVRPFADTVEIVGGGTPKTSSAEYWNGDIPWFSVVDAPVESDIWVVSTERKLTPEGVRNSSTQLLPVGATIITARGTVGRLALVGTPMAMNQSCYALVPNGGAQGYFTYFATRELVAGLQQHAHGSVFDTITRDTLGGVSVAQPSKKLIDGFESTVHPLMERVRAALFESRSLAALRDALLPKLISGELRIADADRSFGGGG